jgi:AcrR family transcriptional regulator
MAEPSPGARSTRPLREDARRNRELVLQAAQTLFATRGVSVAIDEIARAAGVGAGTVWRHFPTKEALFEAVVLHHLEQLVARARAQVDAPDPGEAFFAFLGQMVEGAAAKRDLVDALAGTGVDIESAVVAASRELRAALGELLAPAQRAGAVRADLAADDVMDLVAGAFLAAQRRGADAARTARLAALVLDSFRA